MPQCSSVRFFLTIHLLQRRLFLLSFLAMATSYYCTLFDSFYLSRGLCLIRSLMRNQPESNIDVYCFDEFSYSILKDLNDQRIHPVSLSEFETPRLLEVKRSRTMGEYCWTCTPHTMLHSINILKRPHCTYLDSDIFFFSSDRTMIEELNYDSGPKHTLITPHFYPADRDQSEKSGIYCVQYVRFESSPEAMKLLQHWGDQCLDWCFNRHENGKFGDQKYLDRWPQDYPFVHVTQNRGAGLAPWNISQYRYSDEDLNQGPLQIHWETKISPVIFYHFHGLKILKNGNVDMCHYWIPDIIKRTIYLPYVRELTKVEAELKRNAKYPNLTSPNLSLWQKLKRLLKGTYNIIPMGASKYAEAD